MRTNKLVLKYIELANLKGQILKSVESYSVEQLNFKPSESEWSISQVIEHLIESETGTNKYISYRLKNIQEQPSVGLANFLKSKVLNKKLKSDQKFKVPSVLSEPEVGADYPSVKEKWDKARLYLIQTVENYPKEQLNKAVFKHPRAGLLSMNQTLAFMINHLNHHIPQIDRLRLMLEDQNKKS